MAFVSNGTTMLDAGSFSVGLGSLTHIKTITASNDANVDFEHGSSSVVLDSTYPIYLIKLINIHPASNDTQFQFQGNAAGETGFNETINSTVFRAYHDEGGTGQAVEYYAAKDQANGTSYQSLTDDVGNGNPETKIGLPLLTLLTSPTDATS